MKDSLNRASSTVDVAVSAGGSISDLLNQMKAKALAATDTSLDANSRHRPGQRLQGAARPDRQDRRQCRLQRHQPDQDRRHQRVRPGQRGRHQSKLTVAAVNLGLGGGTVTVTAAATFTSAATASAQLALVNSSITNVNAAVAKLGTGSTAIQTHLGFIGKLQDTLTTGVGNLVDADVAKESANLTALQTKQQLGVQALSIANSVLQRPAQPLPLS